MTNGERKRRRKEMARRQAKVGILRTAEEFNVDRVTVYNACREFEAPINPTYSKVKRKQKEQT